MSATYSAFFSSGLLAPRAFTPPPPILNAVEDNEEPPTYSSHLTIPTSPNPQPRLRKRRSSTSLATSPLLNAIKSPAGKLKARSRSGSLSTNANLASNDTTLMGRMRSRTISIVNSISVTRPKRRRPVKYQAPLPAPLTPAPTGPLPPVPRPLKMKLSMPVMSLVHVERSPVLEKQTMFVHEEEMKEI